jgi:hypothetical protein
MDHHCYDDSNLPESAAQDDLEIIKTLLTRDETNRKMNVPEDGRYGTYEHFFIGAFKGHCPRLWPVSA